MMILVLLGFKLQVVRIMYFICFVLSLPNSYFEGSEQNIFNILTDDVSWVLSHVLESHYSLSQCSPQVSHNRCSSLHTSHLTQSQQTSPAHQHTHCKHINFLFSTTILRLQIDEGHEPKERISFYRQNDFKQFFTMTIIALLFGL